MKSLEPDRLDALRFDAAQLATLRTLGEYRGKQALYIAQTPDVLRQLRDVAVIESTESSNRIEGVTVAPRRLQALMREHAAPRDRSEQEVAGYRDALALIHESARDMPFTPNVILQIHATMTRYMAAPGGRWKQTDNDIIERRADGTTSIRFRPVAAHLTPIAMENLTTAYAGALDRSLQDPLVLVPLAILDFLCIHPFTDGNGRASRLLMLMLLYQQGYEVGRYISLERVIEDSKEGYYDTLQRSSQGWHDARHDVRPWLDYCWAVLLAAYREFEERVGSLHRGRGAKGERVRTAVLARAQPFSISDIEAACAGISRDTVRAVLRQMKAEGVIESTGKGRGAKWVRRRQEIPTAT